MWSELNDFANSTVIYKELVRTEKGFEYKPQVPLVNVRIQECFKPKYQTGNTVTVSTHEVYYLTGHSSGMRSDFVNNSIIEFNNQTYTIDSIEQKRFMDNTVEYVKLVLR